MNESNLKLYHREMIDLCDRFPKNEEMLILKIQSLKALKKRYKYLESVEELIELKSSKS